MDVETNEGKPSDLAVALRQCEPDRKALQAVLDDLFKQLWTESIYVVEESLRVTAPSNRHLLAAYRNRILNEGNRIKRLLPTLLKDYMIRQVYEHTVHTQTLAKGNDPWGLPLGVKMPPSMQLK